MAWSPEAFEERRVDSADAAADYVGRFPVVWVNVTGLANLDTIERIGERFSLHRLALEDAVHTHQRPKVEEYPERLFIVFRAPEPAREGADARLSTEQISLFLGPGFVITFQEGEGDCFEPVRDRARANRGRMRTLPPGYLAYALLDAAIDAFFPVAEELGERIESIEQSVLEGQLRGVSARIYQARHDLMAMRRAVWPLRDMLGALLRDPHPLFHPDTRLFLRDCYDHTVQLMDIIETYRDLAAGLMDVYLGMASVRMNEIMKVLTLFATLFMPLTFIVGVYGMNFDTSQPANMPELGWRYGYLFALGLCAITVVAMLWYTRRKGWLRDDADPGDRG